MTKTAEQLKANFKKRHGYEPGKKPPEPVTAEQRRAVEEAIQSRDKAAAATSYSGPDYLSLIEAMKKQKGIGYVEAAAAVLKTPEGQAARNDFLRRKNPGIDI